LRVLIGCEHSGVVRNAFRALGHDAWSCDLLPATDASQFHLKCDVLTILDDDWHLAIFHPDCTYLTCSAEWAYKDPDFGRYPGVGYHQKVKPDTLVGAARREARRDAVAFALKLWNAPIKKVCIENPRGHLSRHLGVPQYVQPYEYGDDASKITGLWMRGLPRLIGTLYVPPRIVNGKPRWANQTDSGQNNLPPSEDRWAIRATTYPGIANAMADQWGGDGATLAPAQPELFSGAFA
jgi:hypothetical protein